MVSEVLAGRLSSSKATKIFSSVQETHCWRSADALEEVFGCAKKIKVTYSFVCAKLVNSLLLSRVMVVKT